MSSDPGRRHGVLLLLCDAPEDVVAARQAAAAAAAQGTRILAAVVLPPLGLTTDAALVDAVLTRRRSDAAAVSARVRPTVDARDVPLTAVPLLLPAGRVTWSPRRLRRALRLLVRRTGAGLVVVPPRPVLGLAPELVAAMVPGGMVAGGMAAAAPAPRLAGAGSG